MKYNYQLKKTRTQFTPKQILHLEEKFLENQFPSAREREAIANELNLTTQHIQVHNGFIILTLSTFLYRYGFKTVEPNTDGKARRNKQWTHFLQ